jgi:hypothetical protein
MIRFFVLKHMSCVQAQVASIQEESAKLQAAYAGDKAMEITNREREVLRAWMELQVTSISFIKTDYCKSVFFSISDFP